MIPDFVKNRLFAWFDDNGEVDSSVNKGWSENFPREKYEDANLILSTTPNGKHKPCIDLDLDCALVPSKTPGHYHLYINHDVQWEDYLNLLSAMNRCGIVQQGFLEAARYRKYTACRVPKNIQKEESDIPF